VHRARGPRLLPAHLAQQRRRRGLPVVGEIEDVPPHVEDPPLHAHQVGDVVGGPGGGRPLTEQREHRGEHRAADGRGRVRAQ
jgi:hypothetical protein